jgi:MoxR-like ATPase
LQIAEIPVPPAGRDLVLPPLPQIVERVQEGGFFPVSVIASLHAGLWSHGRRHFAILTGLSGSGKTLLARSYAHALAQDDSGAQLITVPVQPGWYDPGALLGYVSPLVGESFVDTPFLRFLLEAAQDPERPHVVVLDEMNLSHPEQYMAPILSAMETGGAIELHTAREQIDGVPASLPYPENLVIIGTVNMDETTHGLSDKILDRAFVLEFWEIDLDHYPRWDSSGLSDERTRQVREVLAALMAVLAPARLHFGWRVVDDVLGFLVKAAEAGDALAFEAALDSVVYAKVLPKLRGEDSLRFREALTGCLEVCRRFGLARSAEKVAELDHDLTATGSARFWR